MENELQTHLISFSTERIILQSFTDSLVVFAMIMAFQTVHLNPVITLAEFFALTTAWPMCCAMIVMQIIASITAIATFVQSFICSVHLNPVITLAEFFALTTAWPMCCAMIVMQIVASVTAIATFVIIRSGGSELQMPTIISDITIGDIGAAYHLQSFICSVHLNPVITLAEFFALTTAWPMCCAMIVMQIIASITAIATFVIIRSGGSELQMPTIISDITIGDIGAAYHLILSQFIGTLLVIITHLLITKRTGSGLTALAKPGDTPLSVVAAVFVSSLLCLLNSTIGWNPLVAFALASYGSIENNFGLLRMQGIFWIGPCLASLFACFLYRLLFATKESRLIKCTTWCDNDHL
ncbi:unnamed protein product [Brugia pahangi]|uniref:Aquaporin n=1 Tax=Brugia pahangi TaxID=6280 RepID=A0A0N4TZH0_BRUPA|nr:unnamed protein product [Brugia pahangi]